MRYILFSSQVWKGLGHLVLLLSFSLSLQSQTVSSVFGFPSAEPGYSLGVSACYAGRVGEWLVMAGGCNFPEPGQPKRYYAGIYAARIDSKVLSWRLVGWLPEAAAYGAAVSCGDSLLFVGGCNNEHSLSAVYSVRLNGVGDEATVSRLASLPCSIDNMAVAQWGGDVYVIGGNQSGCPSSAVLRYSGGRWKEMTAVPGSPRVQPVAAASNEKVYVWGGFFANGENSIVHTDGYCLDLATGTWLPLAAPCSPSGEEMTLSGATAWSDGGVVYATGGVNKVIFLDAISGRYECVSKTDYLKQPIEWYRFSGNLYKYDTVKGKWLSTRFASKGLARAGAQAVATQKGVFYIGGELKPAVRTPQIVAVTAK